MLLPTSSLLPATAAEEQVKDAIKDVKDQRECTVQVESDDVDRYEKQAEDCDDHRLHHLAPGRCYVVVIPVCPNVLVREPEQGEDWEEKKKQDKLKHPFYYGSVATALAFAAALLQL